jgi:hypothetical protein
MERSQEGAMAVTFAQQSFQRLTTPTAPPKLRRLGFKSWRDVSR